MRKSAKGTKLVWLLLGLLLVPSARAGELPKDLADGSRVLVRYTPNQ